MNNKNINHFMNTNIIFYNPRSIQIKRKLKALSFVTSNPYI